MSEDSEEGSLGRNAHFGPGFHRCLSTSGLLSCFGACDEAECLTENEKYLIPRKGDQREGETAIKIETGMEG